jgi:hypothetical protein
MAHHNHRNAQVLANNSGIHVEKDPQNSEDGPADAHRVDPGDR